ncbi:MAG: DUF4197 domain-containing protein [Burkholderiales bacterium]
MIVLYRRQLLALLTLGSAGLPSAWALDLSKADASAGLRTALERGAAAAVDLLGQTDGFLGNPKVRIPLPGWLDKGAQLLKAAGQGEKVDELVTAMNRAAEAAVPAAKPLLLNAVKSMKVADAQRILSGGDTSVTEFFSSRTREPLGVKFLPIVTDATQKVDLARKANAVMGSVGSLANKFGFGKKDAPPQTIEQHVTAKALDGLFLMIGEEERKIRQDPVGTGSAILQKVFGGLK